MFVSCHDFEHSSLLLYKLCRPVCVQPIQVKTYFICDATLEMSQVARKPVFENTFRHKEVLYLACNEERAFSLPKNIKNMIYGLVKSDRCLHLSSRHYLYQIWF